MAYLECLQKKSTDFSSFSLKKQVPCQICKIISQLHQSVITTVRMLADTNVLCTMVYGFDFDELRSIDLRAEVAASRTLI